MDSHCLYLFCDASFDPDLKCGGAAILWLDGEQRRAGGDYRSRIQTRLLDSVSNARLELQTLLWGLAELPVRDPNLLPRPITIFTDHEATSKLTARRPKLEAQDFKSLRTKVKLGGADLYVEFFAACDRLNPTVQWLKGHSPAEELTPDGKIFAQVDRAARRRLRESRK